MACVRWHACVCTHTMYAPRILLTCRPVLYARELASTMVTLTRRLFPEFNVRQHGGTFVASDLNKKTSYVRFSEYGIVTFRSVSSVTGAPPAPLLQVCQNKNKPPLEKGATEVSTRTALWPSERLPAHLRTDVEYVLKRVNVGDAAQTCVCTAEGCKLTAGTCSEVTFANPPRRGAVCTEHALHSSVLALTSSGEAKVSTLCNKWLEEAMLNNGHSKESLTRTKPVRLSDGVVVQKEAGHRASAGARSRWRDPTSGAHHFLAGLCPTSHERVFGRSERVRDIRAQADCAQPGRLAATWLPADEDERSAR